jgi:5,6-dimethylbenzimidazole synthase
MMSFETAEFQTAFEALVAWRRDVRRFLHASLPDDALQSLVDLARLSPSVGLSQPWRFVRVRGEGRRAAIRANFERCNAEALAGYDGEDAALYARLKLEGLSVAPEQLAVFCDHAVSEGRGLGRRTMPEMLDYSVVIAVHTLWLAARARGIGVGWVSILDPEAVARALDAPPAWRLIAYLCIGWPEAASAAPELQSAGWERRLPDAQMIEV